MRYWRPCGGLRQEKKLVQKKTSPHAKADGGKNETESHAIVYLAGIHVKLLLANVELARFECFVVVRSVSCVAF